MPTIHPAGASTVESLECEPRAVLKSATDKEVQVVPLILWDLVNLITAGHAGVACGAQALLLRT